MKTFTFNRDYNYAQFEFQGFADLKCRLQSNAFFTRYNYRDGVVSGYSSDGEKHQIGFVS